MHDDDRPLARGARRTGVPGRTARVGDADAWEQPSLCPGWSVHDVLAHLVEDALTTRFGFVARLARAGLDSDRLNRSGIRRQKGATPADTLGRFRAVSDRTTSPHELSGPGAARLRS